MLKKTFVDEIRKMLMALKQKVAAVMNIVVLAAYWNVGKRIAKEEGRLNLATLLTQLSLRLAQTGGLKIKAKQLQQFRLFYLMFPDLQQLRHELSWSHYCCLLKVQEKAARDYYHDEAARGSWSLRQLERNIASFYFQRICAYQHAHQRAGPGAVAVKDPYVLDFLEDGDYSEGALEEGLIQNIEAFLLELGAGFAFVARQYRIKTASKHFYIDLVFYNYLLKCFILIDLKVTELTHQDIGQMDMYVRMFERLRRLPDDQPTLGIILCKEKDQTIVQYSVLEESKHLFASSYSLVLPSEDALKAVLEQTILP
jgi:predicted nuclease of restriction endonuclease-like (RecB) superfamily